MSNNIHNHAPLPEASLDAVLHVPRPQPIASIGDLEAIRHNALPIYNEDMFNPSVQKLATPVRRDSSAGSKLDQRLSRFLSTEALESPDHVEEAALGSQSNQSLPAQIIQPGWNCRETIASAKDIGSLWHPANVTVQRMMGEEKERTSDKDIEDEDSKAETSETSEQEDGWLHSASSKLSDAWSSIKNSFNYTWNHLFGSNDSPTEGDAPFIKNSDGTIITLPPRPQLHLFEPVDEALLAKCLRELANCQNERSEEILDDRRIDVFILKLVQLSSTKTHRQFNEQRLQHTLLYTDENKRKHFNQRLMTDLSAKRDEQDALAARIDKVHTCAFAVLIVANIGLFIVSYGTSAAATGLLAGISATSGVTAGISKIGQGLLHRQSEKSRGEFNFLQTNQQIIQGYLELQTNDIKDIQQILQYQLQMRASQVRREAYMLSPPPA